MPDNNTGDAERLAREIVSTIEGRISADGVV